MKLSSIGLFVSAAVLLSVGHVKADDPTEATPVPADVTDSTGTNSTGFDSTGTDSTTTTTPPPDTAASNAPQSAAPTAGTPTDPFTPSAEPQFVPTTSQPSDWSYSSQWAWRNWPSHNAGWHSDDWYNTQGWNWGWWHSSNGWHEGWWPNNWSSWTPWGSWNPSKWTQWSNDGSTCDVKLTIVPSSGSFISVTPSSPGSPSYYTITSTLRDSSGNYITNAPIVFTITTGPRTHTTFSTATNDVGTANWLFPVSTQSGLLESIQASYYCNGQTITSDTASLTTTGGNPPPPQWGWNPSWGSPPPQWGWNPSWGQSGKH